MQKMFYSLALAHFLVELPDVPDIRKDRKGHAKFDLSRNALFRINCVTS